jgi:aminoglycoside 6-adenylyltransferase
MREVEALLAAVGDWGRERPDVQAIFVVGSQARVGVPADRWSDVDLVLVVDDPAPYLGRPDWVEAFGRTVLTFLEPTAIGGFVERRVLYETGAEVDFAVLPSTVVGPVELPAEVVGVFARGYLVLLDEHGLEARIAEAVGEADPPRPPSATEFAALTHDFWYHALLAAKELCRGEVWLAKHSCDGYLKMQLVRLLAWHAQAADPDVDTWHGGRLLERWADPELLAELPATYARYDTEDIERALWSTVDLFERAEQACAERCGLPLTVPHEEIRRRMAGVLADKATSSPRP